MSREKMDHAVPEREPDLACGQLKIWVIGRQFSEAMDYWDGNWIDVVAECSDEGACVTVRGSILHLGEILKWHTDLAKMDETLSGSAELSTTEPNLHLKLSCDHLGHVLAVCSITPDHLNQSHTFRFEIDQSYLKAIVRDCHRILEAYPIRDPEQKW
jgi:hypothetical protein